jgi:hypothetical protein
MKPLLTHPTPGPPRTLCATARLNPTIPNGSQPAASRLETRSVLERQIAACPDGRSAISRADPDVDWTAATVFEALKFA